MKEDFGKAGFENALRSQSAMETGDEFTGKYEEDIKELKSRVDEETFAKIEELQAHKLDFVTGLKNWRKKFWNKENRSRAEVLEMSSFEKRPGAKPLRVRDDGKFETIKNRQLLELTKGEVMAAAEWGTWWMFDKSIDANLQREIMSNQVRYVIAEEFDKQIAAFGKADTGSYDLKRDTYERIEERNFNIDKMPAGILSEKMLMSILTKEMYDHDNYSFKVESVDIYEDVEHKVDFIITYKNKNRGVRVGEPETNRLGIQFTLNPNAREHKEKQINRVKKHGLKAAEIDDLILIVMPLDDISKKYQEWRYDENGKRHAAENLDPRGPDMYWDEATKNEILNGLLHGIEEAEKMHG